MPTWISQVFQNFYASLYNLPVASNSQTQIDEYIHSSQITSLLLDIHKELNAPIKLEELEQAISSAKPGKVPGSDGFTLQYYQTLLSVLVSYMVKLFNDVDIDTILPRDTLRAHISVIPKEGKDSASCSSYRHFPPEC